MHVKEPTSLLTKSREKSGEVASQTGQTSRLYFRHPGRPGDCQINNDTSNMLWLKPLLDMDGKLEKYPQLRARRVLSIFKDVLLRTRRVLLLYNVFGDSALLNLNGTSLNSDSALLALN